MTEEPTFGPGNSVLVTASSWDDDARTACLDRLVEATDAVLGVVYDEPPESFLRPFRNAGTVPRDVRVVSVGESLRSAASDAGVGSGRNVVHTVPDRGDVDDVVDTVASLLTDEGDAVLVFHSLTAVLARGSLTEAVRLVGRFTDRLADTNAVGYFTLEAGTHDRSTMSVFRSLCDATVELTNDDGWTMGPLAERSPPDGPIDGTFDVLRSGRRRHVLRHLLRADGSVSIDDLVEAVGRYETDADGTPNDRRRLRTSLYQIHLPKLVDGGFAEYDETEGRVSVGPHAELAEPFLALAEE